MNVGKYVATFCDKVEGFIDFTKWNHDNITEDISEKYSKSKHNQRVLILNDIVTSLNLSNINKVFLVLNDKLSGMMTPAQIRTSCRMLFREHVSYINTKTSYYILLRKLS